MLTWHYVTRAAFDAAQASEKTSDKLFFLSDTKEIYRGTENFTQSVILVEEYPETPAVGKLYINSATLEGKIYNGTTWTTVIQPVQSTLAKTDTAKPVSGKAVADYVAAEIDKVTGSSSLVSNVTYASATNTLTVTKADSTSSSIPLENVAADLEYNKSTGKLNVKNASGTIIGTGINLDLERFIKEASYDSKTHKITLTFNDASDPLEIDVHDLVDTYTARNTSTVQLTVTGNEFAAEAIVSADEGNMLRKTDNGLFVAATDISNKISKVASPTTGAVATLTADGSVADSKVKIGAATLASAPNATTLATEAAVNAIRSALTTSINGKMSKVATGKAGEIITASSTGDSNASGVKIGGATFATTPNAATVATEAGVSTYVKNYAVAKTAIVANGNVAATVAAASDSKVASEKAFVDAMTWKTTV